DGVGSGGHGGRGGGARGRGAYAAPPRDAEPRPSGVAGGRHAGHEPPALGGVGAVRGRAQPAHRRGRPARWRLRERRRRCDRAGRARGGGDRVVRDAGGGEAVL
ncbi:MAG: hypothetical protein AVDCRST_MAG40-1554, partial [uncultured Gemmatimonadaceae bacterium]